MDPARWPVGRSGREGIGIVEVVVAIGIITIVLAMLLPRLSPQRRYFDADVREFVDNLQVARQLAISRGLHYRLRVASASAYAIEEGLDGGGSWTFPTTNRSIALHPRVQFGAGVGQVAEFNTRGELIGATLTFSLVNTPDGMTQTVVVHPTGLVDLP